MKTCAWLGAVVLIKRSLTAVCHYRRCVFEFMIVFGIIYVGAVALIFISQMPILYWYNGDHTIFARSRGVLWFPARLKKPWRS